MRAGWGTGGPPGPVRRVALKGDCTCEQAGPGRALRRQRPAPPTPCCQAQADEVHPGAVPPAPAKPALPPAHLGGLPLGVAQRGASLQGGGLSGDGVSGWRGALRGGWSGARWGQAGRRARLRSAPESLRSRRTGSRLSLTSPVVVSRGRRLTGLGKACVHVGWQCMAGRVSGRAGGRGSSRPGRRSGCQHPPASARRPEGPSPQLG